MTLSPFVRCQTWPVLEPFRFGGEGCVVDAAGACRFLGWTCRPPPPYPYANVAHSRPPALCCSVVCPTSARDVLCMPLPLACAGTSGASG